MIRVKTFQRTARKYASILSQISVVSKSLKQSGRISAECRTDLDVLLVTAHNLKNNPNSVFFNSYLGGKFISANASIIHNRDLEKAAIKVQNGLRNELRDKENLSVTVLQKDHAIQPQNTFSTSFQNSMRERLQKWPRLDTEQSAYIDYDSSLESAALIERPWSLAKYISTDT